jgi:hypothetical protein
MERAARSLWFKNNEVFGNLTCPVAPIVNLSDSGLVFEPPRQSARMPADDGPVWRTLGGLQPPRASSERLTGKWGYRSCLAGLPATVLPAGTLRMTLLPNATIAPAPIVTPFIRLLPLPI